MFIIELWVCVHSFPCHDVFIGAAPYQGLWTSENKDWGTEWSTFNKAHCHSSSEQREAIYKNTQLKSNNLNVITLQVSEQTFTVIFH